MTREEAIAVLTMQKSMVTSGQACCKALDMAIEALSERTGKWIEVDCFESEKHSVTDMRCSLCGKYASVVLPHRTRCVYTFCPNCGTRMVNDET